MRTRSTLLIALALTAACTYQSSCGNTLDMDNAKAFVANALEKATGQKPEATCPASVTAKAGTTFECTAKFGTAEAKVVIIQNDDQGNVTIQSITGILIAQRLEEQIADGIGKQANTRVEVTCGDRVRPAVAGAAFQCQAKDASGETATIDVKVKDVDGNVSWEIAKH